MMREPSRRQFTAAALAGPLVSPASADEPPPKTDRERVLACGFTEAEADCWELIAKAAGKFFELEKQHPSDAQEVAAAVHTIQNKLLARPTYRKYLELARGKK